MVILVGSETNVALFGSKPSLLLELLLVFAVVSIVVVMLSTATEANVANEGHWLFLVKGRSEEERDEDEELEEEEELDDALELDEHDESEEDEFDRRRFAVDGCDGK